MPLITQDRTFYLGWQARDSRAWYPIGRLDASASRDRYTFSYTRGALIAQKEDNFEALYDFPDLQKHYESDELFPLFKNRIMTPGRHDFRDYLRLLDLSGEEADPLDILAIDGGYRATDSFQVFPEIQTSADGRFTSRFFLHGGRHTNPDSLKQLDHLEPHQNLYVSAELNNPATGLAIQLLTEDYYMLGWAPRYLVKDLVTAMSNSPGKLEARVVKVNPAPAPSKQRVLVELRGVWPKGYAPMVSEEFSILPS